MAPVKPDWAPEIGEIVCISKELDIPKDFSNEVPDSVRGHYPLIMHITPGDHAKNRYVWFFVLHSTEEGSPEDSQKVHFQYEHVDKDGKRVAEHDATGCSSDCREFLFLNQTENSSTKMKRAGWVDFGKIFELPLNCLRPRFGDRWKLRDRSFALIADNAIDLIADYVVKWRPRHGVHTLCQKLSLSDPQIEGLVCWVETPSNRLVDSHGISYTACGPCVVAKNSMGTAKVHVLLDMRNPEEASPRFAGIRDDKDIITAPAIISWAQREQEDTWVMIYKPWGSSRKGCLLEQYIVLEPAFDVSTDDLYDLPSCYMPPGTSVRFSMVGCTEEFAQRDQARFAACAKKRASREVDRYRAEVRRLRKERMVRRQKAEGEMDHERLLQETELGLERFKNTVIGLSNSLVDDCVKDAQNQTPERKSEAVDCFESYLLMCAALARLKHEGAIPRAEKEEDRASDQKHRSDLATAISEVLTGFQECPPKIWSNAGLREALGMTAKQCNPFLYLMNLSPWPTWEDFKPKEKEVVKSEAPSLPSQGRGSAHIKHQFRRPTLTEFVRAAGEEPKEADDSSIADVSPSTTCKLL